MARFLRAGYHRFINLDDVEELSAQLDNKWFAKLRSGERVFVAERNDVPLEVMLAVSDMVPASSDEKLYVFYVNDSGFIVCSTSRIVGWLAFSHGSIPVPVDGICDLGFDEDGTRAAFIRHPDGTFDDMTIGRYGNESVIKHEMRRLMKLAGHFVSDEAS
jgi:hypothetical protein